MNQVSSRVAFVAILVVVGQLTVARTSVGQQGYTPPAPNATPPVPVAEAPSATELFPQDARVHLFPPRPIGRDEIGYFVWISGAEGRDALVIQQWAAAIVELDPAWIDELFTPLHAPASQYYHQFMHGPPSEERARALEELMMRRNALVDVLMKREAAHLKTLQPATDGDNASIELFASRVMMARAADAVDLNGLFCGHVTPNALKLLFDAATDPRTSAPQASALRQYAIDNAPRVLELRRRTVEAFLRIGYRGTAAKAQAIQAGERATGAAAGVYRPVAFSLERIIALNTELLAAMREIVPPEVGGDISRSYRSLAYGPLAVDLFACKAPASIAMEAKDAERRVTAISVIEEDSRQRETSLEQLLRHFDKAWMRSFEKGKVRDRAEGERFARAMLKSHEAGQQGAERTIVALRELAQANPSWNPEAFDRSVKEWTAQVQKRLDELTDSGVLSSVVTEEMLGRSERRKQVP